MTYQRVCLCFELLSPVYIGYLPNRPGTVTARTRCYVPGKNLWAASTAGVTRYLHPSPDARKFEEVGETIRARIVFSYFYLSDGREMFTPDYRPEGLFWGNLGDRDFRFRFTASQLSTAIGRDGAARDRTLHEIEFIHDLSGSPGTPPERVLLAGNVWLRENESKGDTALTIQHGSLFLRGRDIFGEIFIGGEQNYGFGHLRRIAVPTPCEKRLRELWPESPQAPVPTFPERGVLGHVPYLQDQLFRGDIEIVSGREYPRDGGAAAFQQPGGKVVDAAFFFAPGTRLTGFSDPLRMDCWGRLTWGSAP